MRMWEGAVSVWSANQNCVVQWEPKALYVVMSRGTVAETCRSVKASSSVKDAISAAV